MTAVGIGILGFAHAHMDAYCARWRACPDSGVLPVAGWDADGARAEAACARHGLVQEKTLDGILGRADVSAVAIGAETARHVELVEAAAAAGKAIVLQKPLALTEGEADRIVAAVEYAGVAFTMAWQMRVDPHNLEMKELLASGRFGKVFMVRRRHCLPTQQWKDFERSWHVQPELNRDIFADDAAHPIDFLYWLMGAPASVTAEMGTLLNPLIRNDNAVALFRYADGRFGEASCTFAAVAGENTTEIVCENGTIVQNYGELVSSMNAWPPGGVQLKWFLAGDTGWTVSGTPAVTRHGDRIAGLAEPLARFLTGKGPALATAREGRDVLKMTLACYESAEQGRRIQLNLGEKRKEI